MEWAKLIPTEVLVGIITGVITYLTTRRKYMAESKELETHVTNSILSTYKLEFDYLKKNINEYVSRIEELEKRVNILVQENNALKGELEGIEKKYGKQTKTRKNPIKNDA